MGILEELDLSAIQGERARKVIVALLNPVEQLKQENAGLRAEQQRLRDEISRLRGEQPKPKIRGNTPRPPPSTPTNYSSEKARRTPKEWTKANRMPGLASLVTARAAELDLGASGHTS